MTALAALLIILTAPVEIPEGQPSPPWPLWSCETGPPVEVCRLNLEVWR